MVNVKEIYDKNKQFIHETAKTMYECKMRMRNAVEKDDSVEYHNTIALSSGLMLNVRSLSEHLPTMDFNQLTQIIKLDDLNDTVKELCTEIYNDLGERITVLHCIIVALSMEKDRFWEAESYPDINTDILNHRKAELQEEVH